MEALLNFCESLAGVIANLVGFLVDFILNIGTMVEMLVQAVTAIPAVLAILPLPVTGLLGSLIAIAVIYKGLGRE